MLHSHTVLNMTIKVSLTPQSIKMRELLQKKYYNERKDVVQQGNTNTRIQEAGIHTHTVAWFGNDLLGNYNMILVQIATN
jgi:hypothetical protein